MRFRPCIDIHHGAVKQIVGGTLSDRDGAVENFVSDRGAGYFAQLYRERGLRGGHIILLDPRTSEHYANDLIQAYAAFDAYPGGMQAGGGVDADSAAGFIGRGASHIIVTSYVFKDGMISRENLEKLVSAVGREHIVLDLSCRKRDGRYYIVTDRWQKFTDTVLDEAALNDLAGYADEFLVHAADVEGRAMGIETDVVRLLGRCSPVPCTYAGGIGSYDDILLIEREGGGRVDFTVGSALDIFGGRLRFEEIAERYNE